jgi:hypothetical protein
MPFYERIKHLQILVSIGVPEPIPYRCPGKTVLRRHKEACWFYTSINITICKIPIRGIKFTKTFQ